MRVYRILQSSDKPPLYTTDFMDIWDILDNAKNQQQITICHLELTHSQYMQIPAEQKKEIQE